MSARLEEKQFQEYTAGTITALVADTTVDDTAGGVVLIAANANRKHLIVQNTGAENIRVAFGTNPGVATGIQLRAGVIKEFGHPYPIQTAVKAIREGGSNSTAMVMEIT